MRLSVISIGLLLAITTATRADDTAGSGTAPQTAAPATSTATAPATTAAPAAGNSTAGTTDTATATETPPPPTDKIYMVARVKLSGTDLTQAIFFRSDAITTLEDCEAERTAGLTTGWSRYNARYLKTLRGVAYKVDYRCVQGKQHLEFWHRGAPMNNFYLVRTRDNKLDVQPRNNFFSCRDALKSAGDNSESIDAFCAISSQGIINDSERAESSN